MKYTQSFIKAMGVNGCYFLCLCKLAEEITQKQFDYLRIAETCIDKGFIFFDKKNYNNNHNFFVENPCGVLKEMTGEKWTVKKVSGIYEKQLDEFEIWFWAKNQYYADKGIGHFTTEEDNLLQNSETVRSGKVYSKRIFRRLA